MSDLSRSSGYSEGLVLDTLELVYIGFAGGREPDGCGVGEDRFDYGLEHQQISFLVLGLGSTCEGLKDLETAGGSGCDVG